MTSPLRVFVVAGEPSGDVIAAALARSLRSLVPEGVVLEGIGGEALAGEGLRSLLPMEELSVMGLVEVLPRLPRLRHHLARATEEVRRSSPDLVLTVDSPGFNLRLLRRLGGSGLRRVHYVMPQAWAWRPRRAASLGSLAERWLAVLPFEPAFFAAHGVEAVFVGHPAVERVGAGSDRRGFVARHGLGDAGPLLCLMPGSRRQELHRHLPILGETSSRLRHSFRRLRTILPTLPHLAGQVEAETGSWPLKPLLITGDAERLAAMTASDLAITASGTATLELGLAGVPMIVAHRVHPLTGAVARHLIRVPHVALANLVLGRRVVPELLQSECQPEALAAAAVALLGDESCAAAQRQALASLHGRLRVRDGEPPSMEAARAALQVAAREPLSRARQPE